MSFKSIVLSLDKILPLPEIKLDTKFQLPLHQISTSAL